MKWENNKIVTFKGCCWDAGWEFDAPLIIYSPVQRYGFTGSICAEAIVEKVEDICIDICIDSECRDKFSRGEIKEFKWRGWSPQGFSRRKAIHHQVKVKFHLDIEGERWFSFI